MADDKNTTSPRAGKIAEKEMVHFLRLKEKETERSRLKALEAMILLEQRNRGIIVPHTQETEKMLPQPIIDLDSKYTDDGKLKFTDEEFKRVKRLRDYKAERVESFLKKQTGGSHLFLNQRYPFVMKDNAEQPKMFMGQANSDPPRSA